MLTCHSLSLIQHGQKSTACKNGRIPPAYQIDWEEWQKLWLREQFCGEIGLYNNLKN